MLYMIDNTNIGVATTRIKGIGRVQVRVFIGDERNGEYHSFSMLDNERPLAAPYLETDQMRKNAMASEMAAEEVGTTSHDFECRAYESTVLEEQRIARSQCAAAIRGSNPNRTDITNYAQIIKRPSPRFADPRYDEMTGEEVARGELE
ncbi:MAG: hypothetical protein ABIA21_00505 [Candidatus Aenigmatarchaeota archaeon]